MLVKIVAALVALTMLGLMAFVQPRRPAEIVPLVVLDKGYDGVSIVDPASGTTVEVVAGLHLFSRLRDDRVHVLAYDPAAHDTIIEQVSLFDQQPNQRITINSYIDWALVAPQGCWLFFDEYNGFSTRSNALVNYCTGQMHQLGTDPIWAHAWRQDGTLFYFQTEAGVYRADAASGIIAQISTGQMVFLHGRNSAVVEDYLLLVEDGVYWVLDLDDGGRTRLFAESDIPPQPLFALASPTHVYYTFALGQGNYDLYEYDVRSRTHTLLFEGKLGITPLHVTSNGELVFMDAYVYDYYGTYYYSPSSGLQAIPLDSDYDIAREPRGQYVLLGSAQTTGDGTYRSLWKLDMATGQLALVYGAEDMTIRFEDDGWLTVTDSDSNVTLVRPVDGKTFALGKIFDLWRVDYYHYGRPLTIAPLLLGGGILLALCGLFCVHACDQRNQA